MLGSELLGMPVVDADGTDLGPVRDVRVDARPTDGRLTVRWLVVGGRELAHRFGYIDGRTRGPWLLERLLRGDRHDDAIAVRATDVAQWGPDVISLRARADQVRVPLERAAQEW